VVFGALVGAITWNVLTWYYGIPSSSSHALIGGIVGAVIAKAGAGALVSAGVMKTVASSSCRRLAGFPAGLAHDGGGGLGVPPRTPSRVDRWFRRLQLVSAGAYSLGHGGNDAQKTIGIIWMLLIATGYTAAGDKSPPGWVIVSCYIAIAGGTMFGGWRIVKTMGQKITKLKPVGGFCAETGGAITLFLATAGHSGVDHAHHHRRHRRRGFRAARQRGALGRGGQHRLGLDLHHPGQRVCGGRGVLGQPADFLSAVASGLTG
jgi:PiT family inorganic phosphate transporter